MTTPLTRLRELMLRLLDLDRRLDEIKINQGAVLAELHRQRTGSSLRDFEFTVFSQWGEDGIIQHLVRHVPIANRTFIEFGVQDYCESNTRFLLMKDHWQGYVIDGSESNMTRLRASYFYWKHSLAAKTAFITRDNVAGLLDESGFDKDLGILSVDVDGVDYYLLEQLAHWKARIVIVEYNAVFGSERAVTVPYDASFVRAKAHSSNLYYGASLPAFQKLLDTRGYALVGVNSVGNNAFFVRREFLSPQLPEVSVPSCFRESTFRETRDDSGDLLFVTARQGRHLIDALSLIDTTTGESLNVRDLFSA